MVKVYIPAPLRKITQNNSEVNVNGETIEEVIDNLDKQFPGIKENICGKVGSRRYLNIFYNDDDIRFLDGYKTVVEKNSAISLVPQLAGGSLRGCTTGESSGEVIEGLGITLSLIHMGVITDDNIEKYVDPKKEVDYYNLLDRELMYYKPRLRKPKFR